MMYDYMNYKELYGLVETPNDLVERMLDLIDIKLFKDENFRFLDTGSGRGIFAECLKKRIGNSKNIDIVEINSEFKTELCEKFENVYIEDFLNYDNGTYDVIVGNPPYNSNGLKKVPTNKSQSKKNDGQTLWINFLYKSIEILKPGGTLCYIIPNIWMKNNHIVYKDLIKYNIEYIIPYTSTESNKIFSGNCQTPTCVLVLKKMVGNGIVNIYDKIKKDFIEYDTKFNRHMPLIGVNIVSYMYDLCDIYGSISSHVKKTNVISKKIRVSKEKTKTFKFKNVETCLLNKTDPYLKIGYSNNPCPFYGEKKIILSHKMYGFPYMDCNGEYGISKRDNYVLSGLNDVDFKLVFDFLSSNIVNFLMETTRYRMKYLEKYVFDFIPNVVNMKNNGINIVFDKEHIISLMKLDNERFIDLDVDNIFEKYFISKYNSFDFFNNKNNDKIETERNN